MNEHDAWSAAPFVPPRSRRLATLEGAARRCTGCPLYADATQTVFGSGSEDARAVLVGEQPGDVEDRRGRPFVGPAGRVLWECVEEAGLRAWDLYVTNAVKHFKHTVRGKRRIHQRPNAAEIEACHPWVTSELRAVPDVPIVALGAVAARSVLGRSLPIAASRGRIHDWDGRPTLITYHPSAVLRADERAEEIRAALVADLRRLGDLLT